MKPRSQILSAIFALCIESPLSALFSLIGVGTIAYGAAITLINPFTPAGLILSVFTTIVGFSVARMITAAREGRLTIELAENPLRSALKAMSDLGQFIVAFFSVDFLIGSVVSTFTCTSALGFIVCTVLSLMILEAIDRRSVGNRRRDVSMSFNYDSDGIGGGSANSASVRS